MDRPAIERRIVTVLFADLVGFTALSERLDAEDVASIQEAYFSAVRETVDRYGGRLEKFIGDAAMAVYGVPRTTDDDAERAVRAGLALCSAVEALGGRLGLDSGQLRLRVGVNTGEVAYTALEAADGRVTGDAVNVAARLQAAAPVGAVLIGEATAMAVGESIELGPLEALALKGKAEPVRAAIAVTVLPERSRDRAIGLIRAPLQGRAPELEILREAAQRAAIGAVEAWCLVAPPGVGKTRLLEELERSVTERARDAVVPRVWRAKLRPDEVAPFRAVADLIRAASQGNADLAPRLSAAGVPAERISILAREVDALDGGGGEGAAGTEGMAAGAADLGSARETRFAAWLEVLEALAGDRSAIWIVEDVHWAGGDLLAFLTRAAEGPSRSGRLVATTARPSLLERAPEWLSAGPLHRLELEALPGAAAAGLVSGLVGDALPDALVAAIAERSDGNPLFIEELLRTWACVGVLERDPGGGTWRLTVAPETVPLPQTVQQIYAAQLDDLPSRARLLARRASVAGRQFPVAALSPLGVDAPYDGLEVLRRRALLAGPRPEPITGDTYSYRHALLRDAGYASLARAERALLHVRLARWMEGVAGERKPAVAELIGGHYAAALEASSALATEVADGLDRHAISELAAHHLELAAEHALQVAAHDAARSLLTRSLQLTPDDATIDRARRLTRLGAVIGASGDADEALALVQEARAAYASRLEAFAPGPARDGYAEASVVAAWIDIEQLRFRDGAALAREALAAIGEADDLASMRLRLARAHGDYYELNDHAQALEEIAPVLAAARALGDRRLTLAASKLDAYVRAESGKAGAEAFEAYESVARELGRWEEVVSSLVNRSTFAEGDRAEAEELLDEAERIATAHALTQSTAWVSYSRAALCFRTGDWDEAIRHGLVAVELGEKHGYHRLTVRTWFVLTPIAAVRGDRSLLARICAWFDARGDFPDSPYARLMHTAVDLDLAAVGLRDPFVPDPERLSSSWEAPEGSDFICAMERVVEAWLDAGQTDAASSAIASIEAHVGRYTEALGRSSCRLLRARCLAATGAMSDASAAAREALVAARESGAPRWIARALETLARTDSATAEEGAERAAIEASLVGQAGAANRPV